MNARLVTLTQLVLFMHGEYYWNGCQWIYNPETTYLARRLIINSRMDELKPHRNAIEQEMRNCDNTDHAYERIYKAYLGRQT